MAGIELNKDFEDELRNLHRLHCITKDFNHIIEYQSGSWKMFEPSKFIYSYFTFNSLYNIDWENSIKLIKLIDTPEHHPTAVDGFDNPKRLTESDKYKFMIDFIFDSISPEKICKILTDQLLKNKTGLEQQDEKGIKENIINSLNDIIPDRRIKQSKIEDFKKQIKKLLFDDVIKRGKLKNDIIWFVYMVRNNIFHGTKTTTDMIKLGQRDRLLIYTNILIGVNELLFQAIESQIEITFSANYKIKL